MKIPFLSAVLLLLTVSTTRRVSALQPPLRSLACPKNTVVPRRSVLFSPVAATTVLGLPVVAFAATPNGLPLTDAPSGLKWADAKVGTGQPLRKGSPVSIDYSMASTVGRIPRIYSTKDKGSPYRWVLGDGSTIAGIEQAIVGDESEGIPPMRPGGIRRVVVPAQLGFKQMTNPNAQCIQGGENSIGPIPPKDDETGSYRRWYNLYCNPRIPYQPDLVLDIKLYGKRAPAMQ